jgi:hypothetical protein
MFVTGRNDGYLYYWAPENSALFSIRPFTDDELDAAIQVATEFLNALRLAIASPAEYLEPPCLPRSDVEWQEAASHWLFCKRELDAAKDDEANAKKALIKLAGKKSSEGYWVRVSFGERIGNVDWNALCKAHGISDAERDKFRKKSTATASVRKVNVL